MTLTTELTTDPEGIGYAGRTAAEIIDLGTAMTRPGPFPALDIVKLFAVRNKMDAAQRIAPLLAPFNDIDFADAAHLAAITNGLDWLIGKTEIDDVDKIATLALNQNRQSRFDEIKLGKVTVDKIKKTGFV